MYFVQIYLVFAGPFTYTVSYSRDHDLHVLYNYTLPAHKISDHIGMAYDNIDGVFLLINVSPVKVLSESSFNPGSFLIELL